MLSRKILVATGTLALVTPTFAYADTGVDRFDDSPTKVALDSKIRPASLDRDAKVTVMVELSGDPVAVVQGKTGAELPATRASRIRAGLKKSQDRVKSQIRQRGGKVHSQMQSAFNGMRVTLPRAQVKAVSQLSGVKSVQAVRQYRIENTVSVPYLGVPQVWQNSKYRGEGVKVAIIDTGVDYTHATFNGPGTVEAFKTAKASNTFTPTARVKGGYDFVGDDYDASREGSQPVPDANPLDCNGHGTHVAGTAGGGGVTPDGKAYTGPYNANTAKKQFKVGPGVAPKVDLYALKVFGCEGSTDVVVEAIDWAVKNRVHVINMSLGSSFGDATEPDSIAAQNAQAAGVVVVAAAGNSGHNPYITGSPAAGRGVISVAAVDSTSRFPAARLTFNGTTMQSINANGATLPTGGHTIVNLTDDPATPENEALGCSVAAYTKAGISSAPGAAKQIAVTTRGTCARVARGVFGQQAGADAVIMVNSDATYPPFEGPITSNPDTGEAYDVTIPFLGVRSSDRAALLGAEGKSLTMAATTMTNPGYKGFASFTSGGPRSLDSGVRPSVSAPGVSINSAAVGTGNGAAYNSGTSMAAPHVAGVAALARQAHKGWSALQVSAAVVSTADPAKVKGYRLTLGGGLVDAKQAVSTQVFAIGDRYSTRAGTVGEATLSFGFHEPSSSYRGTKRLTLVNKSSKRVTFTLKNQKTSQSRPATVTFSRKQVKVPARSSRTVNVSIRVQASTVGSSLSTTQQFNLREVSGNVRITTNGKGTLRVPYLMVPRAQAKVFTSTPKRVAQTASPDLTVKVNGQPQATPSASASSVRYADMKLTNPKGALKASADFYTWGLRDEKDVASSMGRGFDLRAAGVASVKDGNDQLLVFAINNWNRWSNAAAFEFDVVIDTNRDGKPDYAVFSFDSGAVRAGDPNGLTEVFVVDIEADELFATGFLAQAPTDSSTILLPVYASDLGLTAKSGAFEYQVASFSSLNEAASDQMPGVATYDPWNKAISNGNLVTVGVNKSATVRLAINDAQVARQKPLGTMVVVLDNRSGVDEALLRDLP